MRIAQRQSVLQMYLTVAGVIYGYYFLSNGANKHDIEAFFTVGITAITLGSSALMCMHNRVIKQLTDFMMRCEKCSAQSIAACGGKTSLFYFCAPDAKKMEPFHLKQRWYHRLVLAGILSGTNGYAIYATWNKDAGITAVSLIACVVAVIFMLSDMFLDLLLPSE